MTNHADVESRKLSSVVILATLLAVSACSLDDKKPASQEGKDASPDVPLAFDGLTDKPATGGSGSGSGGTGGVAPGTGGSRTGGSGGAIDGGGGAIDGAGVGGMIGLDASVDSGVPGLMGIGGFAPYSTGPRAGGGPFYCPRMMLFSPEMNQAAVDDAKRYGWPLASFYYGVATLNGAQCCSCWQLVFDRPEQSDIKFAPPRPLIIQMFNSGGNDGAFDIYLGKGGLGNVQNRCPAMYKTFPMTGENPWNGGIRAAFVKECGKTQEGLASAACVQAITKACNEIVGKSDYVTEVTRNSCIVGNMADTMYHENFKLKARKVECPQALTEVTGCRLKPGNDPKPDPAIQTVAQAASWGNYSTTTMQDCSAATCAWPENVRDTDGAWNAQYLCDEMGRVNAKSP